MNVEDAALDACTPDMLVFGSHCVDCNRFLLERCTPTNPNPNPRTTHFYITTVCETCGLGFCSYGSCSTRHYNKTGHQPTTNFGRIVMVVQGEGEEIVIKPFNLIAPPNLIHR